MFSLNWKIFFLKIINNYHVRLQKNHAKNNNDRTFNKQWSYTTLDADQLS